MKNKILLISSLLILFTSLTFAQEQQDPDSVFIYKNETILWKEAINNVDSITFKRYKPELPANPELISFSFQKANNDFLMYDIECGIQTGSIFTTTPLITRSLVATFTTDPRNTVKINGVEQISGITKNDFDKELSYTVTTDTGQSATYTVNVSWINDLPSVTITTLDKEPIVEKSVYIRSKIEIDGKGFYPHFADSAGIRGRGNSTWGMPKKPYRFKLDAASELLGLAEAKDWILLADYLDPTLLMNTMAMKAGQLLELEFTHHTVPVTVTLNGEFIGVYTFTEHKEVHVNRTNIDKKEGVLFELDSNYDEDYKFKSASYDLPVMFQSPDMAKFEEPERTENFNLFKGYFEEMEAAIKNNNFPNTNYKDLIDIESVAKFLIIYDLTENMELNHPKSTYLYKDKDQKFKMGPIWDFDWAFGYEGTGKHFSVYNRPVINLGMGAAIGGKFFGRFFDDPAFKQLYRSIWVDFRANSLPLVIKDIEDNAANVSVYQAQDYQKWGGTSNYTAKIEEFTQWLENRASYIDSYTSGW